MSKKIVVLAFTFPPYQDVGARRWTKFCKELIKSGHDVRAITFKFGHANGQANWIQDIEIYKDRIEYFPSYYPRWLENPNRFFDKIMYHLSLLYVKLFTKGNYYDRSSFLRNTVLSELQKKIGEGYTNIIVSSAPFKLSLWASELKQIYPHINLIIDFRDPWVDNKVLYGLNSMSQKRQQYEFEAEKKVVSNADFVLTVADEMTTYFKSLKLNTKTRFITLNNGFDMDDFQGKLSVVRTSADKGKIKLIFLGSIYVKAMGHVHELFSALDNLKENFPIIYDAFILEFYGRYPNEVLIKSSHHKNVKFFGTIPNHMVYEKIKDADACMTFLTDEITYCFNTKFYEYLSQRKPILIFSKKGSASDYIVKNHIGYSFEPGLVKQGLLNLYSDFRNNALVNNPNFDISSFNVKNISREIEKILI